MSTVVAPVWYAKGTKHVHRQVLTFCPCSPKKVIFTLGTDILQLCTAGPIQKGNSSKRMASSHISTACGMTTIVQHSPSTTMSHHLSHSSLLSDPLSWAILLSASWGVLWVHFPLILTANFAFIGPFCFASRFAGMIKPLPGSPLGMCEYSSIIHSLLYI